MDYNELHLDNPYTSFDEQYLPLKETKPKRGEYQRERENTTSWVSPDDEIFIPSYKNYEVFPSRFYDITQYNNQLALRSIHVNTDDLIRLPELESHKIIDEINTFWKMKEKFDKYGLLYKRGILLYGKPGTGKSCLVKMLAYDVINNGGIVINFTHAELYIAMMRIIRSNHITKNIPIVVIMEDIDVIMNNFSKSTILNILDGLNSIDRVLYIATSNNPNSLEDNITRRPSRFDRRILFSSPNEESRILYFKFLLKDQNTTHDVEKWAKDTDGFDFASLKEFFISYIILGHPYKESLNMVSSLIEDKIDMYERDNANFGLRRMDKRVIDPCKMTTNYENTDDMY